MHDFIYSVFLGVTRPDGTDHTVLIEPQLSKGEEGRLGTTGSYKLYKHTFGDGNLETEPPLPEDEQSELPDETNPDFLGNLLFDENSHWVYDKNILSIDEQQQVANFILTYDEGDVNY